MMQNETTCYQCGSNLVWRAYEHREKVGKATVTDRTAFAWQCVRCGEPQLTLSQLAGYERRALALVLRDGRFVDGEVFRRARKALRLKQKDLARHLGCAPETLSRWESAASSIPRAEQLAVVALLDGVEHGTIDPSELLRATSDDSEEYFEVRPLRQAS